MTISRRNFLKKSLALAAVAVAADGLTIFGPNHAFADDTVLIPHATHYGPFKAVVKDGVLIGIQPLEGVDAMPTKMLTEGIISRTYDKTRIGYPMVRKSWLEGYASGDTKPELRGKDSFVRVSWDEALALAANAILNTVEEYGNEALFSTSYGGWSHAGIFRPQVLQGRLFGLIGGHTVTTGDYSAGAGQVLLPHIIGDMEVYSPQTSWEVIADNTEVFVLIGADPWKNNRIEYRVADHQMYSHWKEFKDRGIKFVSINPQYTSTDEVVDSDWVKIIPNTDTALFLAMSYHVYKAGIYDKAYLDKYTVGFDKYLPYLLGEDGSEAKTPEWAAKITGIPAAKIKELAELFAKKRTQFAASWAIQRADHGEMSYWAIVNFAAMLGKIGKPGQGVGFSWHYGNGGTVQSGAAMPVGLGQGRNPVSTRCPASRLSDLILNPGSSYQRDGVEHVYPKVKLIYNAGNNFMSHQQDTNELINAMAKNIDTVIVQDPWWTASAKFADIVFPATTTLERNDITSGGTYSNDKIYAMRQVIEPVAESLDDFEIFKRLGDKMGVGYQFSESLSVMDIIKSGYEGSAATMPFDEFWEKGVTQIDVPESARSWVRHGDFYNNPDEKPLHTVSGKIELYSETFEKMGLEDLPPMPKFLEPIEYLGNAKEGQVHVVSPHPFMRLHSQMANADIRKYQNVRGRQHVLISLEDAAEKGIKNGDLVELGNERGRLIAGAVVTDKIMKGVVSLEEGNWLQLDSKGRCNSGAINMLTTSKASSTLSQATSANTCIADLKKCIDAESENLAFEPPHEEMNVFAIDIDAMNLIDRSIAVRHTAVADLSPGEKLFYERCTLCHVPREPGDYTQKQWLGITPSMFARAGLSESEQKIVADFLNKNAKDAK